MKPLGERAFESMIERGSADAGAGRMITNKEMRRRIESWSRDGMGGEVKRDREERDA